MSDKIATNAVMAVDKLRRGAGLAPVGDSAGELPSPRYSRPTMATELSQLDTPRKNKRKLSEPKRRTTDFSIKRFCPDSPGSACSESARSDESAPENVRDEPSASPAASNSSPEACSDREALHPHLRPPFVFPGAGAHPYFIPQFYYNQPHVFPRGSEHHPLTGIAGALPPGLSHPGLSHPGLSHPGLSHPGLSRPGLSQAPHGLSRTGLSHAPSELSNVPRANSASVTSADEEVSNVSGIKRFSMDPPAQSPESTRDVDNESPDSMDGEKSGKCRKNYKNMTRERRVEANARERSRVHTISAAFDGLRHAVPSYSYNQKLSKLAILRIACSYINALSNLADVDVADSTSQDMSFADCVDNCTQTIQTEGKARRRH